MSVEKQIVVDLIEALENGCVQVRTAIRILDDGQIISSSFHRHVVVPGDNYSSEDTRVQAICAIIQTPDVIEKYKADQDKDKPEVLTPAE